MTKKVGSILLPPGVFISKHEKLTADYLAEKLYKDVTFLVPDRRRGAKTPDILMDGVKWEIKCPKGRSSRTIENNLRAALKQSRNIVIDLRRMDGRIPTKRHINEISKQFEKSKIIKKLIVVTRDNENIDLSR